MNFMKRHNLVSISLYFFICFLVFGWWSLAFRQSPSDNQQIEFTQKTPHQIPPQYNVLTSLSPIKRETLQAALSGDISIMAKLIIDWDLDAQILEAKGLPQVKRLPRNDFIRSQILGRQLKNGSPEELLFLSNQLRPSFMTDDKGTTIHLDRSFTRFLPQTYASASFLLALVQPEQIMAIPKGFRELSQLYPRQITNRIPLDIGLYNAEKWHETKPQIAFVAHYSHPSTLQALKQQGIKLFTLKKIESVQEIMDSIVRVGHVINNPLKAELLKIFIEASMLSIDNRLLALNLNFTENSDSPRFLFLNYYSQYSAPTAKSLTGQLLKRIGMQNVLAKSTLENKFEWMIPLNQEQIVNLNPDYVIIATDRAESLKKQIFTDQAFKLLTAMRNNHVCFIDPAAQESPSQYIVLAYFDIFEALQSMLIR